MNPSYSTTKVIISTVSSTISFNHIKHDALELMCTYMSLINSISNYKCKVCIVVYKTVLE